MPGHVHLDYVHLRGKMATCKPMYQFGNGQFETGGSIVFRVDRGCIDEGGVGGSISGGMLVCYSNHCEINKK
jgi:hypothetical protein